MNSVRHIYTVAGIGELLWDILPEGKRLGGAPANFALHAHALGGQANILSSIGHDRFGRDIIQFLSRLDMSTQYIHYNGHPTGSVEVELSENGHPEYVIHQNVAWDYIQLTPKSQALACLCDAVCFGSLAQRNPVSGQSIQAFVAGTKTSCLRVFDINLRGNHFSQQIIESSLHIANILKLNTGELDVLQDMLRLPPGIETALHALLNRYALDLIALTQGADGSIMMDKDTVSHCPGISVNVKDTIGAGDSFTAAMVMGKLYGIPL